MHERIKDGFHEFIVQSRQDVVVQLDPLEAVQVLEGRGRYVLDPESGMQRCMWPVLKGTYFS
jgi:hypothetical protein